MTGAPSRHQPVMRREVIAALSPRDGAVYVDGTFGAGGYTTGLLDAANCRVWGIDRDPQAIARGRELAKTYAGRLELVAGRFGEMDRLLGIRDVAGVDGVALDLGVSSPQLDDAERGFSFRFDGPLDMRMGGDGPTAADAVNSLSEAELAEILFRYGEERQARRVARAIVVRRAEKPITRTLELAGIVRRVVHAPGDAIDPATRTFQALRIWVNDELAELDSGLAAAERLLVPGGRLAVVSFHSLEDRRVKSFLKTRSGKTGSGSRHLPSALGSRATRKPSFKLLGNRALRPEADELAANPRARSARLRTAERTAAPAWQLEEAA
jgi:16S rRNA (cytosine1402-N4)-methyltransferase